MSDRLDIVLFPKGVDTGIVAVQIELVEETDEGVTYKASFPKPQSLRPNVDPDGFEYPVIVDDLAIDVKPDLTESPEGIDYDELPDLPL